MANTNKVSNKSEFTVAVETLAINHAALVRYLREKYGPNHDMKLPKFERLYDGLNPSDRVPLDPVSLGVTTMAQYLQEPNLGLVLSDYMEAHHQRILLFINHCHFKFVDLLRMLARYVRIASDVYDIQLEETPEYLIVHYVPNAPDTVSYHQNEAFASILIRTLRAVKFAEVMKMDLAHAKPSVTDDQLYIQHYGLLPNFSAGHNKVYFSIESRDLCITKSASADESLRTLQELESRYVKVSNGDSFQKRCLFLLPLLLCLGEPNKEQLAELLCVSPRTLQRKLKEEGTGFRELLQQLRIELSDHHFRKAKASCTELAFALGYRDYKQFHRAFKNWFGVTPEKYRDQVLS